MTVKEALEIIEETPDTHSMPVFIHYENANQAPFPMLKFDIKTGELEPVRGYELITDIRMFLGNEADQEFIYRDSTVDDVRIYKGGIYLLMFP